MTNQAIRMVVTVAIALLAVWFVFIWVRRSVKKKAAVPFSSEAKRAIAFARVEAGKLGSWTIEPVHLLLGLLHVKPSVLAQFITGDQWESMREEVTENIPVAEEIPADLDLPFSPASRHSLQAAAREARGLSAVQIGAEHLLLGLLHQEDSVAALVLRERGVRLEGLRAQVGGWKE